MCHSVIELYWNICAAIKRWLRPFWERGIFFKLHSLTSCPAGASEQAVNTTYCGILFCLYGKCVSKLSLVTHVENYSRLISDRCFSVSTCRICQLNLLNSKVWWFVLKCQWRTFSGVLEDCPCCINLKMNTGALEEKGQCREEKQELQALVRGAGKILRCWLKSLYSNMAANWTISHQLVLT